MIRAFVSLGVAAFAASGAFAAPGVRYTAPKKIDPVSVEMMSAYARCVVAKEPQRAEALVAANEADEKALRTFAREQRGCLPAGRLAFAPIIFRGDMAEAVLVRRGIGAEALANAAAAPAPAAQDMGACVVRGRPADVSALLATKPTSKAENDALAKLAPGLGDCMEKDRTMVTNGVGLRAMLAVGAYRVAMNIPAPAPAGN
jgi:hypothetical protein